MNLVMIMNILHSYRSAGLQIVHSRDDAPRAENFRMHTHTTAEIYCFVSGSGIYHIEGSEYPLKPGDILLMRPAEAHFIEIVPGVPYERICINFDVGLFTPMDPENTLTRPFFQRKAGKRNHYSANDPGSDVCQQYIANMLQHDRMKLLPYLMLLLQEIGAAFDRTAATDVQPDTIEYRIIRYINNHLGDDLSLETLCDHFFISRTQLCRRFKRATGSSVGSYISAKRLITARGLLLQGQKAAEVCVACGYPNYSTFYRAYCAYFGCCPSEAQQHPADSGDDKIDIA